jgi:chaperonin cofactor prefoldin
MADKSKIEELIVEYQKKQAAYESILSVLSQLEIQYSETSKTLERLKEYKKPIVYSLRGGILIQMETSKAISELDNTKTYLEKKIGELKDQMQAYLDSLNRLRTVLEKEMKSEKTLE